MITLSDGKADAPISSRVEEPVRELPHPACVEQLVILLADAEVEAPHARLDGFTDDLRPQHTAWRVRLDPRVARDEPAQLRAAMHRVYVYRGGLPPPFEHRQARPPFVVTREHDRAQQLARGDTIKAHLAG